MAITGHGATGKLTSRGVTENAHGSFDVGSGPTAAMIMGLATPVGFDAAANLAEEAKDPYRGVPHAVVGSVVAAGLFFLARHDGASLPSPPVRGPPISSAPGSTPQHRRSPRSPGRTGTDRE